MATKNFWLRLEALCYCATQTPRSATTLLLNVATLDFKYPNILYPIESYLSLISRNESQNAEMSNK